MEKYRQSWKEKVHEYPKLRTYCKFKHDMKLEKYVTFNISRYEHSLFCQLRIGILPLELETGRYKGVEVANRICKLCNENEVETEEHFIMECTRYINPRRILLEKCNLEGSLNKEQQFLEIISNSRYLRYILEYLKTSVTIRRQTLYK